MKYFAIFFTLVFLLFAGWQYNDPDPILWIPIYGICAYLSWRISQNQINFGQLGVSIVMAFAGAINSWQQMSAWEGLNTDDLSMKTINQELARESLGLAICGVVLAIYYVYGKVRKS